MPNTIEGNLDASDARFGIVVGRFNEFITDQLLDGTLDTLRRHGADTDTIDVVYCPGSFEIPLVAKKMAQSDEYDAVICLGAVIRGDTPHFDYIAGGVANGTAQTALDTEVPVVFGVLTTDTVQQAIERAGTKAGNKGSEAARAAIEMVNILEQLP
jgi:6,7-dimethyl-8-ribityllumazine synthase